MVLVLKKNLKGGRSDPNAKIVKFLNEGFPKPFINDQIKSEFGGISISFQETYIVLSRVTAQVSGSRSSQGTVPGPCVHNLSWIIQL